MAQFTSPFTWRHDVANSTIVTLYRESEKVATYQGTGVVLHQRSRKRRPYTGYNFQVRLTNTTWMILPYLQATRHCTPPPPHLLTSADHTVTYTHTGLTLTLSEHIWPIVTVGSQSPRPLHHSSDVTHSTHSNSVLYMLSLWVKHVKRQRVYHVGVLFCFMDAAFTKWDA